MKVVINANFGKFCFRLMLDSEGRNPGTCEDMMLASRRGFAVKNTEKYNKLGLKCQTYPRC